MHASPAEQPAVSLYLPAILYPVAAALTLNPAQGTPRHVLRRQIYLHMLDPEQFMHRHDPVGLQLAFIFPCKGRKIILRPLPRFFQSCNSDGLARLKIDEGGGHNTEIKPPHGPLTQTAAGDGLNRIGCAAVYFDEDIQLLLAGPFGIRNANHLKTDHAHAHADNLSGAEMTMYLYGLFKQFFKGFHHKHPNYAIERCAAFMLL